MILFEVCKAFKKGGVWHKNIQHLFPNVLKFVLRNSERNFITRIINKHLTLSYSRHSLPGNYPTLENTPHPWQ